MNILDSIISFFKNIFSKKENIKMLEAPTEPIQNEARREFANSLKVHIEKERKAKSRNFNLLRRWLRNSK